MKVGYIGLGKMGRPMAEHLIRAGYAVSIHNRSRPVVDAVAALGARPCSSAAEVGQECDIVMACLTDAASCEAVFFGSAGLLETARPGQIFVDHSTVSLKLSKRMAAAFADRGAYFLDAPVSGGVEGARAGTLTIMAGGDGGAFETAQPIFATYGRNVRHVGPSGAGTVVKLANQLLTAVNTAALAEAFVMGMRAGADPQVMYEVISTGYGNSTMLQRNAPRFLARDFVPGGTVNQLIKDLGFIHEIAESASLRLLLASTTEAIMLEARAAGYGDDDMASLIRVLEDLSGVEVRVS